MPYGNALHHDKQRTTEYIGTHKATSMQFEARVLEQNGGTIDRATIEAHNTAIRGYKHSDELAAKMRAASGIHDESINAFRRCARSRLTRRAVRLR